MQLDTAEGLQFRKRIYNVATFRAAIDDAMDNLPDLRAAARGGRVDKAFAERLMLAVTAVNGCRYCSYGHSAAALRAGVEREEIAQLLGGDLAGAPAEQVPALLFAQHYAETEGHPEPQAWHELETRYGPQTARDIMAYIRMIMVGNLSGNTLDALLSRLRGAPAVNSSLLQEVGVLAGSVLIIPASIIRHTLLRRFA